MRTKAIMMAILLCGGLGCDTGDEAGTEDRTVDATKETRAAALTAVADPSAGEVAPAAAAPATATASVVVGNGTEASCTEAALEAAMALGGEITFKCNGAATIVFTRPKTVSLPVTIKGHVVFNGSSTTRLFIVPTGASLTLNTVTLESGLATDSPGGAIVNHGTLLLNGVTVRNCKVSGDNGGAIYSDGLSARIVRTRFENNGAANGGAIYADAGVTGSVTVLASEFRANTATTGGAILVGPGSRLVVIDGKFIDNQASSGGAIFASVGANVALTGSLPPFSAPPLQFDVNIATDNGGAIYSAGATMTLKNVFMAANASLGGGGGAIFSTGKLTLTSSFFFSNQASGAGGGLCVADYNGAGATATVDRTLFLENMSSGGGGVSVHHNASSLVVTNSAFSSNSAIFGGGLQRWDAQMRIENSSFTNNTVTDKGGGIVVATTQGQPVSYVRMQSVTVAGNTGASGGGGVYNISSGLEMYSMTIANNTGGGVLTVNLGNSRFRDTVLKNGGANCAKLADWIPGTISDDGANLSTDLTCDFTASSSMQGNGLDPQLGPLTKDPNGLTSFMKPNRGSPLTDRGVSCPALDQIGAARQGPCDVGAVEFGEFPIFDDGAFLSD